MYCVIRLTISTNFHDWSVTQFLPGFPPPHVTEQFTSNLRTYLYNHVDFGTHSAILVQSTVVGIVFCCSMPPKRKGRASVWTTRRPARFRQSLEGETSNAAPTSQGKARSARNRATSPSPPPAPRSSSTPQRSSSLHHRHLHPCPEMPP